VLASLFYLRPSLVLSWESKKEQAQHARISPNIRIKPCAKTSLSRFY